MKKQPTFSSLRVNSSSKALTWNSQIYRSQNPVVQRYYKGRSQKDNSQLTPISVASDSQSQRGLDSQSQRFDNNLDSQSTSYEDSQSWPSQQLPFEDTASVLSNSGNTAFFVKNELKPITNNNGKSHQMKNNNIDHYFESSKLKSKESNDMKALKNMILSLREDIKNNNETRDALKKTFDQGLKDMTDMKERVSFGMKEMMDLQKAVKDGMQSAAELKASFESTLIEIHSSLSKLSEIHEKPATKAVSHEVSTQFSPQPEPSAVTRKVPRGKMSSPTPTYTTTLHLSPSESVKALQHDQYDSESSMSPVHQQQQALVPVKHSIQSYRRVPNSPIRSAFVPGPSEQLRQQRQMYRRQSLHHHRQQKLAAQQQQNNDDRVCRKQRVKHRRAKTSTSPVRRVQQSHMKKPTAKVSHWLVKHHRQPYPTTSVGFNEVARRTKDDSICVENMDNALWDDIDDVTLMENYISQQVPQQHDEQGAEEEEEDELWDLDSFWGAA